MFACSLDSCTAALHAWLSLHAEGVQAYLALQQQLLILPQHELVLRLPLLVAGGRVKDLKQEGPHIWPDAGLQPLPAAYTDMHRDACC